MADNTANFTLKLKTENMDQAEKQSRRIRENLEGANRAGSSSKFAQSAASSSTRMAGQTAGMRGIEVEEYNRASGAFGKAGGTARDFADQARGLGGLVRLYATFAANIFAATAAFTALSNAMDTTNMIKGLDQLGAASGRNLGTLSKDLVLASDGAISLRDAMEATAKASAAGLTNRQITQLGEAARKASQALGVNMPDALSRLSRGISKIEPELLDELGLFVKIEDAAEQYARKLGKTSSSLSDFERRQAFAVAVLDQANQKFSNINIDVNPYSKLLASLQNLLQSGLELINKVLTPLIKYLSESPVALAGVIAAIGVTLLRQVIPVVGQWRQGLRAAAEDAAQAAKSIKESFGDEFQARLEARFRIPDLQKSLKQTEEQIDKIQKKQITVGAAPTRDLARSAAVQATEADQKAIGTIERMISARKNYVETGIKDNKKLSQSTINTYTEEITFLNRKLAALTQELQLKELLAQKTRQQAAIQTAFGEAQIVADRPPGRFDPETIQLKQYEDALKRRDRLAAVSNAAENARVLGVRASWILLNKEVADNGITGISRFTTLAQGGLTAVGTRIMGIVSSLGTVGAVIGAVVAGWELLNSYLTKNAKESQAADDGFKRLNESAKFVDSVLGDISRRDPLGKISVESINARATAFNELASGLEDQFQKIIRQVETAGPWDVFIDGFKQAVGKDLLSNSAREFSFSISQAFKLSTEGLGKSQAIKEFKESFNVDPSDREALRQVLVQSPEKFIELAPKVVARMKELGIEIGNTASRGKELRDAFDTAEKTLKDFVTSSLPTDPVAKFGSQLIDIGVKLDEALKNPETTLAAIADIAKNIGKQSLLGNIGKDIAVISQESLDAVARVAVFTQALQGLTDRQRELQNKASKSSGRTVQGLTTQEKAELNKVSGDIVAIKGLYGGSEQAVGKAVELLKKAQEEAFTRGANLIQISINAAFTKAALTLSNAFADRLGDTEAGVMRRAELEKQSNSLQISQLRAQQNMLTAQSSLQDTIEANTKAIELSTIAQKEIAKVDLTPQEQKRKEELTVEIAAVAQGRPVQESAQKRAIKLASDAINAQIAQIASSNIAVDIKAQDQLAANRVKTANEILNTELERLNTEKTLFELRTRSQQFLTQEQLVEKSRLDFATLRNKQEQERAQIELDLSKQISTLTDPRVKNEKDRLAAANAVLELSSRRDRLEQKFSEERLRNNVSFYQFVLENEERLAQIYQKRSEFDSRTLELVQERNVLEKSTSMDLAELELQIKEKTVLMTEEQLSKERKILESRKIQLDFDNQVLAARKKYDEEIKKISEQSAGLTEDQIYQQLRTAASLTDSQIAAAGALRDKKLELLGVDEKLIESQKAYSEIFQRSIDSMADALVDFARTGKLSFKSLIDTMIAELVRFQIRQMLMASTGGGTGIFNFLSSAFSGAFGSSGFGMGQGSGNVGLPTRGGAAKGAYFNGMSSNWASGALQKFAKGGAFTNQIVDSPTLFKFARGTGLMGEAGPEAIMPLKRDSQGNLGVRGPSGGNVEVVVNNYSQETATTRETTDSRGNRRIEVLVGDMVAGEMTRTGSNSQRAVRGTFGLQPQLIRR